MLPENSTSVFIDITTTDDAAGIIHIWAFAVIQPKCSEEFLRHLLVLNGQLRFGGFALDSDGHVIFQDSLLSNTLDRDELQASVDEIRLTVDEYDDGLARASAGLTYRDWLART